MRHSPGRHITANAHQRASNRDGSGKRLQPWERQAALDAYRDGEKLEAIDAEFGCSGAAVSQLARRAGVPRRVTRPAPAGVGPFFKRSGGWSWGPRGRWRPSR
jgi:hypothetical protein